MMCPQGNDEDSDLFSELYGLLHGWAGGELKPSDVQRLEQLLRSSKAARQMYLDWIQDALTLRTLGSQPKRSPQLAISESFIAELVEELEKEQKRREELEKAIKLQALLEQERLRIPVQKQARQSSPNIRVVSMWFALAAIGALVIWSTSGVVEQNTPLAVEQVEAGGPSEIATISSLAGLGRLVFRPSDLEEEEVVANIGTRLMDGKYSFGKGFVELRFDSGPSTLLQGPAEFELWAKNGMELTLGKAVTKVPPAAKGFAVSTVSAVVIDLGTEFAVAAEDDGSAEVLVIDGEVILKSRPPSDQSGVEKGADLPVQRQNQKQYEETLVAGNARAVNVEGDISPVEDANRSRFVRSLSGLIAFDDFEQSEGKREFNGGIGFEGGWEKSDRRIAVNNGRVTFSDGEDASMQRSFNGVDASHDPIYFSGEFQIDGNDPVCSAWLALSDSSNGLKAIIGLTDGQFTIRLNDLGSDEAKVRGAIGQSMPGRKYFLVGRLQINVSGQADELSIWIDPDAEFPGDPDKVLKDDLGYSVVESINVMYWDFDVDAGSQGSVDNVKIGTSWEAVQ